MKNILFKKNRNISYFKQINKNTLISIKGGSSSSSGTPGGSINVRVRGQS